MPIGAVPVGGDGRVRLRRRPGRGDVPRGQHPPAGRASRHRAGVGCRPGRAHAARRRRRPGRALPIARAARPTGRCGGGAHLRRGRRSRLSTESRVDHQSHVGPRASRIDGWVETRDRGLCGLRPTPGQGDRHRVRIGHRRPGRARRRPRRQRHRRYRDQPRASWPPRWPRPTVRAATHTTAIAARVLTSSTARLDIVRPGTQSTVQAWPGRQHFWSVGVPPSGPMDDRSFRAGNVALGNPEGAPGLEATLEGPAIDLQRGYLGLRDRSADRRDGGRRRRCPCGSRCACRREPRSMSVRSGRRASGPTSWCRGDWTCPSTSAAPPPSPWAGWAASGGRVLRAGDVLHPRGPPVISCGSGPRSGPVADLPELAQDWEIDVVPGPHAAPEFFTDDDLVAFYGTAWEVHYNSARTGCAPAGSAPAVGPQRRWRCRAASVQHPRHPLFGRCGQLHRGPAHPARTGRSQPRRIRLSGHRDVSTERWKLGQLRPGDTVRFVPSAAVLRRGPLSGHRSIPISRGPGAPRQDGCTPVVTYRANGDDNLLVEYGAMELNLSMRARVHVLSEQIYGRRTRGHRRPHSRRADAAGPFRPSGGLALGRARARVGRWRTALPAHRRAGGSEPGRSTSRCRGTTRSRMRPPRATPPGCATTRHGVRGTSSSSVGSTAWSSVDEVRQIVFDASYLVLGLGDVYLGAPLATPIDPRHRLVTTKYNPARTWTADSSVGIGGAYLCIYGMESPGRLPTGGAHPPDLEQPSTEAAVRIGDPVAAALLRPHPLVSGDGGGTARRPGRFRGRTLRRAGRARVLPAPRVRGDAGTRGGIDRGVPPTPVGRVLGGASGMGSGRGVRHPRRSRGQPAGGRVHPARGWRRHRCAR